MIEIVSTNIISPLGMTSEQNFQAVRSGNSALGIYDGWGRVPERICAALFTQEQRKELSIDGFTRFESIVIRSVSDAVSRAGIDVTSPRLLFILSTTKANVEELSPEKGSDGDYLNPGETALRISRHIGFVNTPVVVCNACISGVTAQLLASRLIERGYYDKAVVCGADCQTIFTVAGFLSFKSLSPEECRPFDIERLGLNLGEAAATVVLQKSEGGDRWKLLSGYLTNDAYHISAPVPDGDGVRRAIAGTFENRHLPAPAMVCAHGTATMFNDQMESKAIERAGLSSVPVTAFKGFYGHTMGASGILESIISMYSLDEGVILPIRGFCEKGVSGKVELNDRCRETASRTFLKTISGFGGCNGALLYSRENIAAEGAPAGDGTVGRSIRVRITPESVEVDGEALRTEAMGRDILTEIYRSQIGDNPRFYKMDVFSRLVYCATELLIKNGGPVDSNSTAMVLFNSSSSVVADRRHLATVCGAEGFFPSPSVFVNTLPNVVLGEIASRNGFKAETSFYILPFRDDDVMSRIVDTTLRVSGIGCLVSGWADCRDENDFEADMVLMITKGQ